MDPKPDLTKYSLTFPELPEPCISRKAWVNWIHDRFSERRKCIVVQAEDGAGKTTLLAQFAVNYADRTFSFFIKPDQYISTVKRFLSELCAQMHVVVSGEEVTFEGDTEQLKREFESLYAQVARLSRSSGRDYFFVVDGLEWLGDTAEGKRFVRALPTHPYTGMYLLASSRPGMKFEFEHLPEPVPPINELEIEQYFEDAGLSLGKEAVENIYRVCNRMPGYLDQLRREMVESPSGADVVIEELPNGYVELLEYQWQQLPIDDPVTVNSLAILAFSQAPVSRASLAGMLDVDEEELSNRLGQVFWLTSKGDRVVLSDSLREFVAAKLEYLRGRTDEILIAYYSQEPLEIESVERLPVLLKDAGAIDELEALVTVEYLDRTLQVQGDISLLKRNTELVALAGYDLQRWEISSKYALMNAVLTTLTMRATRASEVDALLSLGDYEQSFELASRAVLQEDRLQLSARIASKLIEVGEPVPSSLLDELQHMAEEIDPRNISIDRLAEISAELFYALPDSAIGLVNRYAGSSDVGNSVDTLLAILTLSIDRRSPEHVESLRMQIRDKRLLDFTRAHSTAVASMSAAEVIARSDVLEDPSSKLFQLRSWCNANRENPESISVIRFALDLITAEESNPSMRQLRQFAEPLVHCDDNSVTELLERFDLLKDTAIAHPSEEKVRLELVLATIEAKHVSDDRATTRFYRAFIDLVDMEGDLDTRCFGLVRMLASIDAIRPDDEELRTDLEEQFKLEIDELLNNSASHYALVRRMLAPLTRYRATMALDVAEMLNTEERRNEARFRVAVVYASTEIDTLDFDFLASIISRISNPLARSRAYVRVLERLAEVHGDVSIPEAVRQSLLRLVSQVDGITDPVASCFAYAFALKLCAGFDPASADKYFERICSNWSSVDSTWELVEIGFDLATVISASSREHAKKLVDEARQKRDQDSSLVDAALAEMSANTLLLANRTLLGIAKGSDNELRASVHATTQHVARIPSVSIQCQLLADLALRLKLAEKDTESRQVMNTAVVPLLESIENPVLRFRVISRISPSLWEYERTLVDQEMVSTDSMLRDRVLIPILRYVLTGRPGSDPVDLEKLNSHIDYYQALTFCEVLEKTSSDEVFYEHLRILVDSLIKTERKLNRIDEKCQLSEKHALTIARKLKNQIDSKLPSLDGIRHDGYKLSALACLARLRASFEGRHIRAPQSWSEIAPTWRELALQARESIPNLADRALVMIWVGRQMFSSESPLARKLLEESGELIYQIPNVLDRSHRLNELSEVWLELGEAERATSIIREAMSFLEAWQWDETRDQVTGAILETAHRIDPDLAASLSSSVDNPLQRLKYTDDILVKNLKKQPESIQQQDFSARSELSIHRELARELLKSLCTGRGRVLPVEQSLHMMRAMLGAQFNDLYPLMAWSIENSLARPLGSGAVDFRRVHQGLLDSIDLTLVLESTLRGQQGGTDSLKTRSRATVAGLHLFSVGSRDEALDALYRWVQTNAAEYLSVYDPYFTHEQLEIIKYVPPNVSVNILTSWKAQSGMKVGDVEELHQKWAKSWEKIADQVPPPTRIYLFGTKTGGDSPLHERYLITSGGRGIKLGTSESGLGKKDTDLREMAKDETAAIEQQFVNRMIVNPPLQHNGERLVSSVVELMPSMH